MITDKKHSKKYTSAIVYKNIFFRQISSLAAQHSYHILLACKLHGVSGALLLLAKVVNSR
ncbi:hypothetical protein AB162_161 [Candidatus Palibaumannia cicadellinicola]|uniref:Uncharacterized protein n=1 Tax=Candidatus Palibaumannia cicadellinicola TaxID=186490 RepID=A0A0K2BKQ3_9GAMM|nr:hypothetical protein AB162_161 [Candidatus Baumannia cicadellinicola]